jgi:predicted tellurium resistance membrane protein TerC
MLAADSPLFDLSRLFAPEHLWANAVALVTLTALEIVLGIDNIVFIAILSGKLPREQQSKARRTGLGLALITRILFLTTLTVIMGLATTELVHLPLIDHKFTGKDMVLLLGGLFLIFKATHEIHSKVEGGPGPTGRGRGGSFWGVIVQILIIDLVFSIDSVVTAVGMAQELLIMIAAVIVSVGIMLMASGRISAFIDKHPTMRMLALAFLLLIGVMLVADSLGQHINKGYIYFAMAFSLGVEMLNIAASKKARARAAAAGTALPAAPPPGQDAGT